MNIYLTHLRKILYILLFSTAVWFISFSLFPENQIIKIEVGDTSPATFSAPRFISIIDEFYERKVKLVLTTDTCYKKLYQGKKLNFEFERTKSRLSEMSTLDYQKLPHKH